MALSVPRISWFPRKASWGQLGSWLGIGNGGKAEEQILLDNGLKEQTRGEEKNKQESTFNNFQTKAISGGSKVLAL